VARARTAHGATRVHLIGFCWGGLMATRAAGEAESPFARCGSVHGARLAAEMAAAARVPLLLVPAANDPPVDDLVEELRKKPFFEACASHHIQGADHGFMAARGDWNDPAHAPQRAKTLELCKAFFI
jgi:dienelactone hydrolase